MLKPPRPEPLLETVARRETGAYIDRSIGTLNRGMRTSPRRVRNTSRRAEDCQLNALAAHSLHHVR